MTTDDIRSKAALWADDQYEAAPPEAVEAMVRFEERYGGLWYPVLGSNGMEHGLQGEAIVLQTPLGPAFRGIMDGDQTWGVDILADGRTAMGDGHWPYRVIDRSVDQRLERHALLITVAGWYHRTFTCLTPPGVAPVEYEQGLPQPVAEASGPAELWWLDEAEGIAVQARLHAWPNDRDVWILRYFARTAIQTGGANPVVFGATIHETVPALLCVLCAQAVEPGRTCLAHGPVSSGDA